MFKKIIIITASLSTLLAPILLNSTRAFAQSSPDQVITLSPIDQTITQNPGTSSNGSFEVINQGSNPTTFHIYAAPFRVVGEDYQQEFTALPGAPNVTSWFSLPNTTINATGKQLVNVPYKLQIPAGTVPGGYYATLFAQTVNPATTNGVVITDRVGEIFYITVAGPASHKGALLSWDVKLLQKSPITTDVRISNSGSVHFPASINVNYKTIFGQNAFSESSTREILPQTIRRVPFAWSDSPSIGIYKVSGTVGFLNGVNYLPGKYIVILSPLARLILVILIVLLVIGIIYKILRRRSRRKKPKTYKA